MLGLLILSESPGDGERNGAFAGVVARSVTQKLEYLNLGILTDKLAQLVSL